MTLQELLKKAQDFIGQAGNSFNQGVVQPVQREMQQAPQQFSNLEQQVKNFGQQNIIQPLQQAGNASNDWMNGIRAVTGEIKNNNQAEMLRNAPDMTFANDISWKNPLAKLPAELLQGTMNTFQGVNKYAAEAADQYYGNKPLDNGALIGKGLSASLGLGGLLGGGGAAEDLLAQGGKIPISQILKQGTITGAKYGAGFGAVGGTADSLMNHDTLQQAIANILQQTAGGAVMGGATGFATGAIGHEVATLPKDIQELLARAKNKPQIDVIPEHTVFKPQQPSVLLRGKPVGENVTIPAQSIERNPMQSFEPQSLTFKGLKAMEGKGGMSIKDVSGVTPIQIPKESLLIAEARKLDEVDNFILDNYKNKAEDNIHQLLGAADKKFGWGKVEFSALKEKIANLEKQGLLKRGEGYTGKGKNLVSTLEQSQPLQEARKTYYHGTDAKFDKFDPLKAGEKGTLYGKGTYLTDSKDVAMRHGKNIKEVSVDRSSLLIPEEKLTPTQITNLKKVLGEDYVNWDNIPDGQWLWGRLELTHPKSVEKILQKAGINGVEYTPIVKGGAKYKNIVSFNTKPLEIKSQPLQEGVSNSNPLVGNRNKVRIPKKDSPAAGVKNTQLEQEPQRILSTQNGAENQVLKNNKVVSYTEGVAPKQQIVKLLKSGQVTPEVAKQEVIAGLKTKFDNFEKGIYGSSMSELQGGTKGATKFQSLVRPLREKANEKIQQGLSSENGLIRNISRGIRGLMGQAGNTSERIAAKGQMKGGIDTSRNLANDFQALGDEMLPDKLSREKVWAHLDPELSGVKVGVEHLSPQELKAVSALREASDLINDQNFALGKISHETWLKGRGGKYITRAYQEYDLPPELSEAFQKGSGKLDLGGYKQRGEVTDWKQENAIKDPFYLASKRIQSTFSNKAITDYGNWASKEAGAVSAVEKAGYTKLSDSPMYGELSGKYVRHDILEDMKGFYSDNKALQGLYDAFTAYDRWKPRQILKKTKTVYNPATRLGNQTSNRIFAIFNGVNPITFEKNMQTFAKKELQSNGKYARVLRDKGILGTDMTKYELVKNLAGEEGKVGKLGKIDNKIASSYGAADDRAKLSAFKYWLDKGKTMDEAIRKVRQGFQDYSAVGQFYDLGAKAPLIGKPFIRFQSELARIIKNSALENPLRLPIVVGSIALIGKMSSMASGETAQDKLTRENRFGTPVVPFTNVPLVFQTPIGEINVARMFGMYETAGADTTNKNLVQRASKYLPFDVPLNKDDALQMVNNDVLTGGVTSLITDTDFRGKSIADQNQSKYKKSDLTPTEQNINRAKYLGYNYNLPVINSAIGVGQAIAGKENQYGQVKTPLQASSAMAGFKINQFGAKEAQDQRVKDQQFAQYAKDDVKKNINSILKDQQAGKIDAETAKKRIENQQSKLAPTPQPIGTTSLPGKTAQASYSDKIIENPTGGFSYTAENGDFKTVDTRDKAVKALSKMELLSSDKNILKTDGGYWRKNAEGDNATFITENKYQSDLITQRLERSKKNEDIKGWVGYAKDKLSLLEKQFNDSNTDELEKETIQNDYDTLATQLEKYLGYGGFTKPKAGAKAKALPKKLQLTPIKMKQPVKISSPKISFSMPKPLNIRNVKSPKVVIKKPSYRQSVAPSQGKRLA